jgi:hypothetical protein
VESYPRGGSSTRAELKEESYRRGGRRCRDAPGRHNSNPLGTRQIVASGNVPKSAHARNHWCKKCGKTRK